MVAAVKANGWPVSIHCNGDATLDSALDAIEDRLRRESADRREPHRTLHDHTPRADRPHEEAGRATQFPDEPRVLLRRRLPRSALRHGTCGSHGSRRTVRGNRACRSRSTPTRRAPTSARCNWFKPPSRAFAASTTPSSAKTRPISVEEALKAVTVHAAGQIGMSDRIGTLEPGKEADLTILEERPVQSRSRARS